MTEDTALAVGYLIGLAVLVVIMMILCTTADPDTRGGRLALGAAGLCILAIVALGVAAT
jgi:hypothetical protein